MKYNTKEKMMDKVIKVYGFEAPETIHFCEMCENPHYGALGIIKAEFMNLMIWKGESF